MLYLIAAGDPVLEKVTMRLDEKNCEYKIVGGAIIVLFDGILSELLYLIGVLSDDALTSSLNPDWKLNLEDDRILVSGLFGPVNGMQTQELWEWIYVKSSQ